MRFDSAAFLALQALWHRLLPQEGDHRGRGPGPLQERYLTSLPTLLSQPPRLAVWKEAHLAFVSW